METAKRMRRRTSFWLVGVSVICIVVLSGLALATGRISLRPTCPEIPIYPRATAKAYTERRQITRLTTYQVNASSRAVLDYYSRELKSRGWEVVSGSSDGFTMDYRTTNDHPPFSIWIMIINTSGSDLEFQVGLKIEGPFAWEYWCSDLKP